MTSIAYLDGEYLPADQARLPVFDLGVVGGIAVAEMLRTFRHQPFRVDDHLGRLRQSLELTGLNPAVSQAELAAALAHVVQQNVANLPDDDDLGVIVFVTAGWNPTYVGHAAAREHGCTVGIHTFPLQYGNWSGKYATGVNLRTAPMPALPNANVDRRIKSRSRMHWHLADRSVRTIDPTAIALLLDADGSVTETAAANVCAVIDQQLISPPPGTVLEGVSLQVTNELAAALGIAWQRRCISLQELEQASEILLTSTPYGLLPVTKLNDRQISTGTAGPVYRQLLAAWSELVGVDIPRQALMHTTP